MNNSPLVRRNMIVQVLLMIVTFGLYGIYWFWSSSDQLKYVTKDESASPVLWTVLLFVPFGCLYSYYCYSEIYEKVGTEKINKWILFILWFFFSPAVWFLVQRDLNRWAEQQK
jgi:hypothetical protein